MFIENKAIKASDKDIVTDEDGNKYVMRGGKKMQVFID